MVEFRRKLYRRGSSFETTIPMPILFAIDSEKKHNVVFRYDAEKERWYIDFEELPQRAPGEEEKKEKEGAKGKEGSAKRQDEKRRGRNAGHKKHSQKPWA